MEGEREKKGWCKMKRVQTMGQVVDGLAKKLEKRYGLKMAEWILSSTLNKVLKLEPGTYWKTGDNELASSIAQKMGN